MSVKIIQVSTLTLTTYPHSHVHTKQPEAAMMTIHNTPDDLIGPPSLNPPSRMHGWAHTHAEGRGERGRDGHLTSLSISVSFCFIKKNKSLSVSLRPPLATETEHCLVLVGFSDVTTCSRNWKHQQFLKYDDSGNTVTSPIFSYFRGETRHLTGTGGTEPHLWSVPRDQFPMSLLAYMSLGLWDP